MLRRFILSRIASTEKQWGVSLEYCRFIVRVSLPAATKERSDRLALGQTKGATGLVM